VCEFEKDFEEDLIINSFELDGEIYPPTYRSCSICSYVLGRLLGFDFSGQVNEYICVPKKKYVGADDNCLDFDIDITKLTEEVAAEYERQITSGELENDDELSEEEIYKSE